MWPHLGRPDAHSDPERRPRLPWRAVRISAQYRSERQHLDAQQNAADQRISAAYRNAPRALQPVRIQFRRTILHSQQVQQRPEQVLLLLGPGVDTATLHRYEFVDCSIATDAHG